MESLKHNGVLVPTRYEGKGLTITVRGEKIKLIPELEEMAIAWVKKISTKYVLDPTFSKNFYSDFSKKFDIDIKSKDIDYTDIILFIEKEKEVKNKLSREEKQQLAFQRKIQKEDNKKKYGFVLVNGISTEVSNYIVEPNSIFIGRGKHPLRGLWKEGPKESDIELNLSPDVKRPPGNWKGIVWQPNSMWIARWQDKLTKKMKYIWLSDSSDLKQSKDIQKFEKAIELQKKLSKIQKHIWKNLDSQDLKRRKIATVCYLIDKIKIRVGDEKDEDETDTIGASTLRPEHVHFESDGYIKLNFLGKDSIPHIFRLNLPEEVRKNIKEFSINANPNLFDGVNSKKVSEFLDEVITGLSAKVFRTCYASKVVTKKLDKTKVENNDPDYKKKFITTMANLEAAKICNHKRTIAESWKKSYNKKNIRLKTLIEKVKTDKKKLITKFKVKEEKIQKSLSEANFKLEKINNKIKEYKNQVNKNNLNKIKKKIGIQKNTKFLQKQKIKKLKLLYKLETDKFKKEMEIKINKSKSAIEKQKSIIIIQRETKDYNLITSLKSYIDPRIYYKWGKKVDYDWKKFYPLTLQKKFSWVEK